MIGAGGVFEFFSCLFSGFLLWLFVFSSCSYVLFWFCMLVTVLMLCFGEADTEESFFFLLFKLTFNPIIQWQMH